MRPVLTPFAAGYTPVILYLTPGNTRSRTTERMYDETANRENEQRRPAQTPPDLGDLCAALARATGAQECPNVAFPAPLRPAQPLAHPDPSLPNVGDVELGHRGRDELADLHVGGADGQPHPDVLGALGAQVDDREDLHAAEEDAGEQHCLAGAVARAARVLAHLRAEGVDDGV